MRRVVTVALLTIMLAACGDEGDWGTRDYQTNYFTNDFGEKCTQVINLTNGNVALTCTPNSE